MSLIWTTCGIPGGVHATEGHVRGFAATLLASLLIAAPVGMKPAVASEGTTLVTSYPQEPSSWDYWSVTATAVSAVTFLNVRQPLVEVLEDGSLAPLLATSWDISDDGLTVTFNIREAKFSDGTSLDAEDVVYSLLRNKESPLAQISVPLRAIDSVTALDDRTVRLNLSAPSRRLLRELGKRSGVIVPSGAFEVLDVAREVVGTGPYIFAEYNPGVDVRLIRNDAYWGEAPYFEKVTHRFIPNETAAINALLAGDIDVIGAILGEGLERVEVIDARDGFIAHIPLPYEISYLFLNTTHKDLQNDSVRQAIAFAIDRETLLVAGQNGFGVTTCQYMVPINAPWNNDYCPYSYDPTKAKELLLRAGVKNLTLYFPYLIVSEFPALKEVLVSQMAQVGITLDAKPLDLSTWFEQVWGDAGDYDIGSITAPVTMDAFPSCQGFAPYGKPSTAVTNPEFDNLVSTSDAIMDRNEYVAAKAEMAKILADDAWVIPLYAKSTPILARADLQGVKSYRNIKEFDLRNLRWAK